jgi:hypothetical protein
VDHDWTINFRVLSHYDTRHLSEATGVHRQPA